MTICGDAYNQNITNTNDDVGETCNATQLPFGPTSFNKINSIYEIKLNNFATSRINDLTLEISYIGSSRTILNTKTGKLKTTTDLLSDKFVITEPQDIYLDFSIPNLGMDVVSFDLEIREGLMLKRYFALLGILSFVVGLINLVIYNKLIEDD